MVADLSTVQIVKSVIMHGAYPVLTSLKDK